MAAPRLPGDDRHFCLISLFLGAPLVLVSPLVLSFGTLADVGRVAFVEGLGYLAGGIVMSLWGGPRRRRMMGVLAAIAVMGAFTVVTGTRATLPVVAVGVFGTALGISLNLGIYFTIVQVKVPQRFHGRVMALNQMISWSTLPIGYGVIAPLGTRLLEPLLAPGGALASTVGAVIGTGPGHGMALMFIVSGLAILATTAGALFFGGAPRRLVPDNLRTGVDRPDLYDPKINRSYGELASHYGVLVDPARARKPRDKARVERPMPYVRDSLWRGREFASIQQMQTEALRWCLEVAGQRSCRPLSGAAPAAVFAAVEAPALLPLPTRPFVLATWSTAKVGPDIHAKVGKTLYSVPWRLIGQRLDARQTQATVQLFHQGQLVATHVRRPAGKQTDMGHYPPEKIAFRMRTPTWCRTRADQIGPACSALVAQLLEVNALFRLRAAQGVLGLADKRGVGPQRLEAACAKALAVGDPSYRTVKGILAAGTEHDGAQRPTGDGGASAHLHGPLQLFATVIPLPTSEAQLELDITTATTVPGGHGDDERRPSGTQQRAPEQEVTP